MISESLSREIDNYISSHRNEIINDLITLVEIPSVKGPELPDAPYGIECKLAMDKSLELFEKNGFKGRYAESKKYIVAEAGQSEKSLAVFSHCDVVSADGEWLYGEPFKLTERNGFLIGRGCNDDKGGIIQSLYAAIMIKELNIPMKNKLVFFVGGCEEDGMCDIIDFVKNEPMPNVSLVPDGEYPYYSAEKSRARVMLESCIPFEKIKDIHGGKSYNAILNNVNIEYNDGTKITVVGKGGHAGHPEGSHNALARFIEESLDEGKVSPSDKEILKDVYDILGDYYGIGLGIAESDSFWGKLTAINGIVRVNEGKLRLSLDIRHAHTTDGETLLKKIKDKLNGRWNIIESDGVTGYVINEDSQASRTIRNVYSALAGVECHTGIKTAGGTYSRYLKNSFSIGTVMPCPELKHGFEEGHGGVHAPDEAMSEKGFLEAIKTLLVMILELDKVV